MRMYTVLRLLFAFFLLYVAWPFIPLATTEAAKLFWLIWLILFIFVVGGNLATILRLSDPPVMEQDEQLVQERQTN